MPAMFIFSYRTVYQIEIQIIILDVSDLDNSFKYII